MRLAVGLLIAVLVASFSGCGDDEDRPPPLVTVSTAGYEPQALRVPVGTRVTFVNASRDATHSAKSETRDGTIEVSPQPGPTRHDGTEIATAGKRGFATHSLFPNERQTVYFPIARRYSYHCAFHEEMRGTIEVVAR